MGIKKLFLFTSSVINLISEILDGKMFVFKLLKIAILEVLPLNQGKILKIYMITPNFIKVGY